MFSISRKYKLTVIAGIIFSLQAMTCYAKSEHDVKAAYLYNFVKFVTWPESESGRPLNLCLFGQDPINERLAQLHDAKIHNRVVNIKLITSVENTSSCTVLFISAEEEKFLDQTLYSLNQSPVLTISDIDRFADRGGTIGFVTMGNVIRFDINLKQARQHNISISSKLLELANHVVK